MHTHIHAHTHTHTHTISICACLYMSIRQCLCQHVCACVFVCVCMCVCALIQMWRNTRGVAGGNSPPRWLCLGPQKSLEKEYLRKLLLCSAPDAKLTVIRKSRRFEHWHCVSFWLEAAFALCQGLCFTVCCSVLQCFWLGAAFAFFQRAVRCGVLQCVAVCCSAFGLAQQVWSMKGCVL